MSSAIYVVKDDGGLDGPFLALSGGRWSRSNASNWLGGGTVWPAFGINASTPGSMTFSFEGVAFALWGNTAPPLDAKSQEFQVEIDDNEPYTSSTDDSHPQCMRQWYQSPMLSGGQHLVTVSGIRAIAIDYVLVTPGPDTPLARETLMVDDMYDTISYTGSGWQQVHDYIFSESPETGAMAFQNGTHQTTMAGDSFSFSYTGTDMSFYGILPHLPGRITLSMTIDDTSTIQSQHISAHMNYTDQFNYLFMSTGPLTPGNHTVNVTVMSIDRLPFILDYILYSPSFNTLSEISDPSTSQPIPVGSSTKAIAPLGTTPSIIALKAALIAAIAIIALLIGVLLVTIRRGRSRKDVAAEVPASPVATQAGMPSMEPSIRVTDTADRPPLTMTPTFDAQSLDGLSYITGPETRSLYSGH